MAADERFYPKELDMDFSPFMRHYERYMQCAKLIERIGKHETWLDCACGSGYGTHFLSNFCEKVIGYDISNAAIEYATQTYSSDRTSFTSNLDELSNTKFNSIISIETIEHMEEGDAPKFLKSLRDMLEDNGDLIITTPIVPNTNRNPKNKFHFIEYSNKDFQALLSNSGFTVKKIALFETTFTDNETKDQGYYLCSK